MEEVQQIPYPVIYRLLTRGEIIPFLGAGASISGRPQDAAWTAESKFLPTASEIARWLAEQSGYPNPDPKDRDDPQRAESYYLAEAEREDLAKVSSYYVGTVDRSELVTSMHDTFNRDYQLGKVHRFLASLEAPMIIVTTNYDDLIERAFREQEKKYHLVAYPTDKPEVGASVLWWEPGATEPKAYVPNALPPLPTDTTLIYKMHGSVDRQLNKWDSFVITEEDYVDFLSQMTGGAAIPARFMDAFGKRRFLFLGYGLRDWNLRVMLRNLKSALAADRKSWVIQLNPSPLEKMLWGKRGVDIYNIDIDTFIDKLKEN